jgi:hypothetical protein
VFRKSNWTDFKEGFKGAFGKRKRVAKIIILNEEEKALEDFKKFTKDKKESVADEDSN